MKHLNWLINTYKPDINAQNDNGDTPLHIAIQNGNLNNLESSQVNKKNNF